MKETFMLHADKHRSIVSNKCLLFTALGIVYGLGAIWLIIMLNTPGCEHVYGVDNFELYKFRYVNQEKETDKNTWH